MSAIIKIKFLAPLLTLLFGLRYAASLPVEAPTITVLCYHTFGKPHNKKSTYTIPTARFEEEMRYLSVQKIPVISLSALEAYLYEKRPLPERSVVITIDDGYKTAKDIAWPILHRYGFPATLFVYPHAISRLRSAMTWDDLRLLARAGATIESHSVTHPLLTHPSKPMNTQNYDDWIDGELRESKRLIEKELQRPVTSIAYPYGGYDEHIVERAAAAGYRTAFTCDDGDVSKSTNPLRLNRRLVFSYTSLKAYVRYFEGRPLEVGDLYPRDGERVNDIPKEIRLRILNPDQIIPETAQILVDKAGKKWHPVSMNAKTGFVRFALPETSHRGYYFVTFRANSKAHSRSYSEATWLFIVKRNASTK